MRLSNNNYMSHLGKAALIALALLLPLAACSDDGGSTAPVTPTSEAASNTMAPTPMSQTSSESMESELISVVVTTNIVADWVENIGGEHVDVFSLVPVGADPHSFQPGAQDVAKIADAELVLSVGLGLEESWLKELLENAARDPSTIVELGEVVDPIEFGESHREEVEEGAEGEEDHEGHGHGIDDPHFWFDPLRVKSAVNDIATRLSVLDVDISISPSTWVWQTGGGIDVSVTRRAAVRLRGDYRRLGGFELGEDFASLGGDFAPADIEVPGSNGFVFSAGLVLRLGALRQP